MSGNKKSQKFYKKKSEMDKNALKYQITGHKILILINAKFLSFAHYFIRVYVSGLRGFPFIIVVCVCKLGDLNSPSTLNDAFSRFAISL